MGRLLKLDGFLKSINGYQQHDKFKFIFSRAKQNKDERLFLYDLIKKEFNLENIFNKDELNIFFNNKSLSILDSAISDVQNDDFWKFLHYKNSIKEDDKRSFELVERFVKILFKDYRLDYCLIYTDDEIQKFIIAFENEFDPINSDKAWNYDDETMLLNPSNQNP